MSNYPFVVALVSYFKNQRSLIILVCKFHDTLRLKIHFVWQKYSTEINKTEADAIRFE